MSRAGLTVVVSIVFAIMASSCSTNTPKARPADEIYADASSAHQDQAYERAIEHYKELLDNYPLDERAEEIELKKAQAHYSNENYAEAIAAFSDFQRMHPTSTRLAAVEYSMGQAFMDQMTTTDRDLGAANNAALRFQSVVQRFPGDPHSVEAARKLQIAREDLAARELYIARFYYRRGRPVAARARLTQLLARYPDTLAAGEGLDRLVEDARESDDPELAALCEAARREHEQLREARPSLPGPTEERSSWQEWFAWLPGVRSAKHDPVAAGEAPPPASTTGAAVPPPGELLPPRAGDATTALVSGLRDRQAKAVSTAPTGGGSTWLGFGRTPGSIRGAGVPTGSAFGSPGLGGASRGGGFGGGAFPGQ